MRVLVTSVLLSISFVVLTASSTHITPSIKITDGDTFVINNVRIRLWGIDAPELKQKCVRDSKEYSCGDAAKTVLSGILQSGPVKCKVINTDRYKRQVAKCDVSGNDVGYLLVRSGWALDYASYSKGFYKDAEAQARVEKIGVWAGQFMTPSKWRKMTRR